MITVQEAHCIIRESTLLNTHTANIPLRQLAGRIMAEEIRAEFPMPRFTNSAMDGFAVMHDDIADSTDSEPARLTVTQELPAGAQMTRPIGTGTCARIMTGAPMPDGADTVVPFEETSGLVGDIVSVYKAPKRGANIRRAGEEVATGDLLISRGICITPAEIAILATFGIASAEVYRQPKVALVTVGDELRLPGEKAEPLSIYNSNLSMLEACVRSAGADMAGSWQIPDELLRIREVLERSLGKSDLLITAGGISTGQYDFMQEALTELGVEQRFWKVAQKPGKPIYFGIAPSGTMVFSLPGNPVSALVCFLEYVMPALQMLQGAEMPTKIEALLDTPFSADRKRHRFLFGQLRAESGQLRCSVSPKTESHMLTALCGANCLIESPPSPEPLPAGSLVICSMLPWAASL